MKPPPKAADQHAIAVTQTARLEAVIERQRQRCSRGVAKVADAVDDAIIVEAEALTDRRQDPRVGLVVDEQVDVVELKPGGRNRLLGRL